MRLPHQAFALAERQLGLITRSQLTADGAGPSTVQRLVAAGHLVPVASGVFRMGGAPTGWSQDVLAACLAAGPLTVGSHRTAGALHDHLGLRAGRRIDLIAPRWHRTHRGSLVTVHEALDLRAEDVTSVGPVPVTTPVRTVLDLASCLSPERLARVADAVVRTDDSAAAALERRFQQTRRRGKRGYTALAAVLEEVLGRPLSTESPLEDRTVALIEAQGLPLPVAQHPVTIAGTTVRLDLAWPDLALAVECDGLAHHRDVHAFRWDRRRQNLLVLAGWTILRVTWDDVVARPGPTGALIADAHDACHRAHEASMRTPVPFDLA